MAEISHAVNQTLSENTRTNAAWGNMAAPGDHDIAAADLDPSSDYILLATCVHGGRATNSAEHYCRLYDAAGAGAAFAQSEQSVEPRRASARTGNVYGFMDRLTTAATPGRISFQGRTDGSRTMQVAGSWLAALKLDDLAAGDFRYSASDVADTNLSTTIEDGESVTLPAGDWGIWVFGRFLSNSVADSVILQCDVGGTVYGKIQLGFEDAAERFCLMTFTTVNVASEQTAKVQYGLSAGSLPHLLSNRIFALRLDAFEDHARTRDTAITDIAQENVEFVCDTLTHVSSTAASRNWFVAGQLTHDKGNSAAYTQVAVDSGATRFLGSGGLAAANKPQRVSNESADEMPGLVFGQLSSHPDNTDLDLDLIVTDNDPPGNGDVIETAIAAFTLELAPGGTVISRTLSDSLAVTDLNEERRYFDRELTDDIALEELPARRRIMVTMLEAFWDITDTVIATKISGPQIIERTVSDQLDVTDAIEDERLRFRELLDSAEVQDAIANFYARIRIVVDAIEPMADDLVVQRVFNGIVTDALAATDAAELYRLRHRTVSDVLELFDAIATRMVRSILIQDDISLVDNAIVQFISGSPAVVLPDVSIATLDVITDIDTRGN